MTLAPVALFACHRPDHVRRTLATLRACPEASQTELYIFADGPRTPELAEAVEATRAALRGIDGFARVEVVERRTNFGLSRSIITGVDQLCASHGRVIVVEDDLILSPAFLSYMNAALDRYADEPRVMQVAGYMFATDTTQLTEDALFLPLTTSWGWATWKRAWVHMDREMQGGALLQQDADLRHRFDLDGRYPYFAMLQRQREGKVDSWAIRWYLTCFLREALIVYPRRSLVANGGMDGSGTHCGTVDHQDDGVALMRTPVERWPEEVAPSAVFEGVKQSIGRSVNSVTASTTIRSRLQQGAGRLAKRILGGR